jgi:hypothetical protein
MEVVYFLSESRRHRYFRAAEEVREDQSVDHVLKPIKRSIWFTPNSIYTLFYLSGQLFGFLAGLIVALDLS